MLKFSNLMIPTSDHAAAIHFYRDLLGMEVVSDFSRGPGRWVNLRLPGQDGVQFTLSSVIPHPDVPAEDAAALNRLLPQCYLGMFHFVTDDLDGLHARLIEGGAEVTQPPTQQPWGAKDLAVNDPSGNLVRINQA